MNEWRASPVGDGGVGQPVDVPGRPAAYANEAAVRYSTTLPDPRDPGDDVATLVFRGLYAHSRVSVTGDRVGGEGDVSHDAYFAPLRIPVRPAEETDVVVTCEAPRDRFGGIHDTDLVPAEAAVPGIWWDAAVETHPLPYVDSVRVRPELTDGGARLHVRTTVVTGGPVDDRLTYSLRPEGDLATPGTMDRVRIETDSAGATAVEHTTEVPDPALWWPRGVGGQHRYSLTAKLGDSERSVTTGICDVERAEGGVRVNGEFLPVRGVNLLTDSPTDVERAMAVNANLVRGHAHVLPRAVYEACDEAGLLVWQDLPLTGPGDFAADRGRTLASTLVDARGTYPSFAMVGVHDNPVQAFRGERLGSGFLDGLRLRWRAWQIDYDRGSAETVARAVPDNWAVVPVVGGPGVDHDAAAYYPGWHYGDAGDVGSLLERYSADLLAEFGAAALAGETGAGTGARTDLSDVAGFDAATHDTRVGRDGDGSASVVRASQAAQADVVSTVVTGARRGGAGVVAFALRDTDRAGMGVYAADGTPKRAKAALATAFEPTQAFLVDPSPGETEVSVVNDRPDPLSTTLSWVAGEESGEIDVTVDASDRWASTVSLPAADRVELTMPVAGRTVTNEYDL